MILLFITYVGRKDSVTVPIKFERLSFAGIGNLLLFEVIAGVSLLNKAGYVTV
jgi:hypothetical protein